MQISNQQATLYSFKVQVKHYLEILKFTLPYAPGSVAPKLFLSTAPLIPGQYH